MKQKRACGTWESAITTEVLLDGARGISEVIPDKDACWWVESRPTEGGRNVLMHWQDGRTREITPADVNVRTTVHEYGGGSWWAENGVAFYVDYADQRVRVISDDASAQSIRLLTPEPSIKRGMRFADLRLTPDGHWLLAVCELHDKDGGEPANSIVAIPTDGSMQLVTLVEGADFYGSPRVSPDGKRLCWVQWNHPNMPWDDTQLLQADFTTNSNSCSSTGQQVIAGGEGLAIVQPEYSPDGVLHFVSDKNDLWHLYNEKSSDPVQIFDGEIGYPPWVFGLSRYCFDQQSKVLAARYTKGLETLDGASQYSAFHALRTCAGNFSYVGCSWQREAAIVFNGKEIVEPRTLGFDDAYLGTPETIEFPTSDSDTAWALFFPPANPDFSPLDDEKPPLIVLAHGGPTSAARSHLNLARQFWTSRGFAVVDVNYRGSSGFGRAYRKKLAGNWGVADVADCVNAAKFLAERGDVDANRLLIRGGSAGGYTVLCAMAFYDMFAAGASMYGVADLEALAKDTHKFESRYLDGLVGAYPEMKEVYQARSPINHLDGFDAPMIVLQGSEDAIVPPNQSRMIVEALDKRGVPVAYIEFDGEQHGFRQAKNIERALLAELEFYLRVFKLLPPEEHSDLPIRNLV